MGPALKLVKWCEPLVTDKEAGGQRTASVGRIMSWIILAVDIGVIVFVLRVKREVTHLDLIFGFLEMLTLFVLGYTFAGKTILNKDKFTMFGGTKETPDECKPE